MTLMRETTYAELLEYTELLQQVEAQAFADDFPQDGAFTAKTIKGRSYWYFQAGRGAGRSQRYVGPETSELLEHIQAHKARRHERRVTRTLVSSLVRTFGMPRALPEAGRVIEALSLAGVFRLRGVLVGTIAFQTYPAMLGRKLASAALQTSDVDIAQFKEISLAVGEAIAPMLDILKRVDPSFHAIAHSSERRRSTSYGARGGLRVDFLTPNRGPDSDEPQKMSALQTDAQPLRFLDFLIHQTVPAVLLHEAGVYVRVPAPERFAIHKLIVAQRRHAGTGKSEKDFRQAEALLEAFHERKAPHDLADAWSDAYGRGRAWRELLVEGAAKIAPRARDCLLKTIGWTRGKLPGIELAFPDPKPRYDPARRVVVFMGKDRGGDVPCAISGEALSDRFGLRDPRGGVALYRERPSAFERPARAKYLTGPIEEPGTVLIRTEDLSS